MYNIHVNKLLPDGGKAEIRVRYNDDLNKFEIYDVGYIAPRKRKAVYVSSLLRDNYIWRGLNFEDRKKELMKKFTEYVPVEILNEALIEAWKLTKPEVLKIENNLF